MKNIFLTGMPGAGKSYWGKKIAAHFAIPFWDLDEYIASQLSQPVEELIQIHGEAYFREKETYYLQQLIREQKLPFICSTGGGTPLAIANRELMRQQGIIVYLAAQIDTLHAHLEKDQKIRPILTQENSNLKNSLIYLYAKRVFAYQDADYVLQVETLTLTDVEKIMQRCINQL